jgi:hypothetical protein
MTIVIINILVFLVTFLLLIVNTNSFLSVEQGVNVLAHSSSFLLGFFVTIPWYYFENLSMLTPEEKNKKKNNGKLGYEMQGQRFYMVNFRYEEPSKTVF